MGPAMADGAPSFFKRRSMMAYAEDADPRFSDKPNELESKPDSGKGRPRIAFTGEEWGFGYKATDRFLRRARATGSVPDAGLGSLNARLEREFDEASKNNKFDYKYEITQPLRTKEQTLMAVKQGTADFAVVPFYSPYAGYDFEALRAISSLMTVRAIEQVEATDDLCLAVHESQLYDLIQSSHPGTGFSSLQRRMRKSWGAVDGGSGNAPGDAGEAEMPRAGLPLDMSDQKLIRDRIDVVFAGPEAARRSKSKLDGLRAIGVEVQEIAQMVEPHRELARLARSSTNPNRTTNTTFDPVSGETRYFSSLGAESQNGKLFAMVLPYEVAMRSSDYVIIDHNFDDMPPAKTRFLVVENNPDHSLYEDKYRTTDAKTAYWGRRLHAVAAPGGSFGAGFLQMLGYAAGAFAALLIMVGLYGVTAAVSAVDLPASLAWLGSLTATGAMLLGGASALAAWLLLSVQSAGRRGVRVIMAFRRSASAAAIGDVENFLRNYGVRHSVIRMDEDSNSGAPADVALDIEFDPADFSYGPLAMLTRRARGSVVNGALKKSFQRWKNRGVRVLAAMPYEIDERRASETRMPTSQLPRHAPRRWWSEGLAAWFEDFTETMFIRFSRVLFFYVAPALVVGFLIWKLVLGG
ncbi:MAG: hypothetical protein AAGD92_00010 [Pseudomonadota bacterium]